MEKHVLSKSTFIRGVQCLKSLYLNKNSPFLRDRLPDAQRAVFKRGADVGLLAQQLFPHGVNLSPKSPAQFRKKVSETAMIIRTDAFKSLYEAVFQFDGSLAILDILVKGQQSWIAYEVKSSTRISDTYLMDAAFQYYVITNSGVALENFFLVYINKDYVFDGALDLEKLFIKQSVLNEVIDLQKVISNKIKEEKEILSRSASPEINIGTWCHDPYPCDFLGHCWKNVKESSVLYLDAWDEKDRFDFYYAGKDDPKALESGMLSEKQKIRLWSAQNKKIYVNDQKLNELLGDTTDNLLILSPYFLKLAVPYLPDTKPYQPVPVACGLQTSSGNPEITFFIREENPIELFVSYFRKIIETDCNIVIYNIEKLYDFLRETDHTALAGAADEKLFDLYQFFDSDVLFDYRLQGDYSAQQVARVFLKKSLPVLDPSLLNMNWQSSLLDGSIGEEVLVATHEYIRYLSEFQSYFYIFLQNQKTMDKQ